MLIVGISCAANRTWSGRLEQEVKARNPSVCTVWLRSARSQSSENIGCSDRAHEAFRVAKFTCHGCAFRWNSDYSRRRNYDKVWVNGKRSCCGTHVRESITCGINYSSLTFLWFTLNSRDWWFSRWIDDNASNKSVWLDFELTISMWRVALASITTHWR